MSHTAHVARTTPALHAFVLGALLILAGAPLVLRAQDPAQEALFKNLQVLPETISDDELTDWMLDNLSGLGLPRFQGRGCLHCHVGDLDQPRGEWDYASDDKREKRIARRMMGMVRDINESHLAGLGGDDEAMRVTCYTCHAGRLNPRPLPDVLIAAYEAAGVDSLLSSYDGLRKSYYAGDAYDFRPRVLTGIASTLAGQGAFDDALSVSARNEAAHPEVADARMATLSLLVLRAAVDGGAEEGIAEFRRLRESETPAVLTPDVLDGLGWNLYRTGQASTAIALFEENRAAFPETYFPLESLIDARLDTGLIERDEAIRLYEEWLERFPTHQRARNRVTNLRRSG